jgi:hypothetical protein
LVMARDAPRSGQGRVVPWEAWSFVAAPCCSMFKHHFVCLPFGFASSRVRMRGSNMNLITLANRPTEPALAQWINLNPHREWMNFAHFCIMGRQRRHRQSKISWPYSNWPTTERKGRLSADGTQGCLVDSPSASCCAILALRTCTYQRLGWSKDGGARLRSKWTFSRCLKTQENASRSRQVLSGLSRREFSSPAPWSWPRTINGHGGMHHPAERRPLGRCARSA